jgi:nucleotide-binding universal stress UspA family protein
MERILVAVDSSENSMKAVDAAATIAAACGASLSLLAVVPSAASIAEELEAYARSEHLLNELPSILAAVQPAFLDTAERRARDKRVMNVSKETAMGDPASAIVETARDKRCDLIVLGSRGRGRLSGLLLGSVSQKVVTHAPCAVLVVR